MTIGIVLKSKIDVKCSQNSESILKPQFFPFISPLGAWDLKPKPKPLRKTSFPKNEKGFTYEN